VAGPNLAQVNAPVVGQADFQLEADNLAVLFNVAETHRLNDLFIHDFPP
jgi:hypothetical protein